MMRQILKEMDQQSGSDVGIGVQGKIKFYALLYGMKKLQEAKVDYFGQSCLKRS